MNGSAHLFRKWSRWLDRIEHDQLQSLLISPSSPTVDVSAYFPRERSLIFPLQRGLVQACRRLEAEPFKEDSLVVVGLSHAARADFDAFFRGQHDVD